MRWEELLERPVLVVSGKGGTGKSTVAAALAVAAARAGRRVLLAEVEKRGEVTRTLGVPDPGYVERPTRFGVSVLSIDPHETALDYLQVVGGLDRVTRPLLRAGLVEQILRGAPGFRDLLACGKVYEVTHVRRTNPRDRGRPLYDTLVLDAPPTGQIAGFLSAPATFAELIRVGPLKRQAASTARLFRERAALVLVAAPEEMSMTETLETVRPATATGVELAAIVLNRTVPPPFARGERAAARALGPVGVRSVAADAGVALTQDEARSLVAAAEAADGRHRAQRGFLRELRSAGPVLELPDVPGGRGPELVERLAGTISGRPPGADDPNGRPAATAARAVDDPATERTAAAGAGRAADPAGGLEARLGDARIVVVCGSGGVGKTTVSAALAVHSASAGRRTVLLTVDPARRLGTALRLPRLGGDPTDVPVGRGRRMQAMQLDTQRTFDELIRRHAGSPDRARRILANPFYRRIADTLAGTHEYMAMEKLYQLASERPDAAIVIDTPPTRSALSFLEAPNRVTDFLGGRLLRWMLWPSARAGRFGLSTARLGAGAFLRTLGRLIGAEVLTDTVEFLAAFEGMFSGFKERAQRVVGLLRSPECAFVVVTAPAGPSLEEAGFFVERLSAGGMRPAAVVMNRWHPDAVRLPPSAPAAVAELGAGDLPRRAVASVLSESLRMSPAVAAESAAMAAFARRFPGVPLLGVPELPREVSDVAGLRRVAAHLFDFDAPAGAGPAGPWNPARPQRRARRAEQEGGATR